MKRVLGPSVAYYLSTLIQIITFRAPTMKVVVDGSGHHGRTWMVVVGNTERTSGGSMRLSPGASTHDGELNVSVIPFSGGKWRTVARMLPKVPTGEHVNEPEVDYRPGRTVHVESDPPSRLDLDGELTGHTPADFRVCPGAIRILTPLAN
jgi:diacylglycerol kinase (ATP)